MKNPQRLKVYSEALNRLANFLRPHMPLINVCMVDFFTEDIFDNVLDPGLKASVIRFGPVARL